MRDKLINSEEYMYIYSHFGDEYSKELFLIKSLQYTSTYACIDSDYSDLIVGNTDGGMELIGAIEKMAGSPKHKTRPIVIFGAGFWGEKIEKHFHYEWDCFVDNNKAGRSIDGIDVLSFENANKKYPDAFYVIAVRKGYKTIENQLIDNGIQDNRFVSICPILDRMQEDQYFEKGIIQLGENEIFVDCGAYDGYTSENFIRKTNGQFKYVYVIEPSDQMSSKCDSRFASLSNVTVLQRACSNKIGHVMFNDNGPLSIISESDFNNKSSDVVKTIKLDSLLLDEGASFIKMDIEGSEIKALEGAKEIIHNYKPKLAVSVYHNPEDIYMIPQLILNYNPEYKLYLRHYTLCEYDTVLYCV